MECRSIVSYHGDGKSMLPFFFFPTVAENPDSSCAAATANRGTFSPGYLLSP